MNESQTEKVNELLLMLHNMFMADMITRAIQDDSLSRDDFIRGYKEIMRNELNDIDEYVPEGWENV